MAKESFVVDLDRCIGCKGCHVACKMENEVALGSDRTTVHCMGPVGTYPDLQMYFLPTMCQQCEDPDCAKKCPTGACYKDVEDGVIKIDKERCIGCKSCVTACPYDAMTFNKEMNMADKCDTCIHLRKIGDKPACVKNCAGRALIFGDINNPESEAAKALEKAGDENIYSLKEVGDNGPGVKYILRNAKWQDVLPQEAESLREKKIINEVTEEVRNVRTSGRDFKKVSFRHYLSKNEITTHVTK